MVIVAVRGMTGGISRGGTYFRTLVRAGGRPGIAAIALCVQPVWVATYQASVVAPVSLRKLRRVGMIHPPIGTAVGCQQPRTPPGAEVSQVELQIQAKHGSRPDPATTRPPAQRRSPRHPAEAAAAKVQAAKRVFPDRWGAGHGRRSVG